MQRPECISQTGLQPLLALRTNLLSANTQAPICLNSTASLGQSSLLLSEKGCFAGLSFLLEGPICLYIEWKRGIEMEKRSTAGRAKRQLIIGNKEIVIDLP